MNEIGSGNDWERLSRAVYVAGYAGLEDITVEVSQIDFFERNRERIEDFASFLLNEEEAAEMEFDISLQFRQIEETVPKIRRSSPKSTDILSFSGGMDSLAAYYLMGKPLPVFVDYGQKHVDREREMVRTVASNSLVEMKLPSPQEVKEGFGNPDEAWDADGFKIPARNFVFFSALSSHIAYGSSEARLAIGAYEGEISEKNRDKSVTFFSTLSDLFSEYFHGHVVVESPVSRMTKVEVANVLAGEDLDHWQIPFCDSGTRCADCKSCFNAGLAFELSDIEMDDPRYNEWLDDLLDSNTATYYRNNLDAYEGRRKREIEQFLGGKEDGG